MESHGSRPLALLAVEGDFAVCRLDRAAPIPAWATAGEFFCVARTADELSVVCDQSLVPDGIRCERAWRCLRVAGSMDFAVVGVLAALVAPLADAGIGIFAFSTFDTDYLLVKEQDWPAALDALRQRGHSIESPGDPGLLLSRRRPPLK